MAGQGALWLAKRYPSTLISVFLTEFRYFSYQVATQLSSRGWVDPVSDPILPEKFVELSRGSNQGSLGWRSDVLTTIPNSCSFSNLFLTSPTSQLILQPFRRFTYVTAHSPTLPLLLLCHSSFSNPSFASPASKALHLIHLASRPWV